ncbi:hypothetical protein Plhal304r1_c001g0000001 [Plasmopara halstedii]
MPDRQTSAAGRADKAFTHPNIMPLADYAVLSTEDEALEYCLRFLYLEALELLLMIARAYEFKDVRFPEAHILDIFLQICRAVTNRTARKCTTTCTSRYEGISHLISACVIVCLRRKFSCCSPKESTADVIDPLFIWRQVRQQSLHMLHKCAWLKRFPTPELYEVPAH